MSRARNIIRQTARSPTRRVWRGRRRQVTDFLRWTSADLLAIKPNPQISCSVFSSRSDAYNARSQDWAAWNNEGILDLCKRQSRRHDRLYRQRDDHIVGEHHQRDCHLHGGSHHGHGFELRSCRQRGDLGDHCAIDPPGRVLVAAVQRLVGDKTGRGLLRRGDQQAVFDQFAAGELSQ